MTHPINCAIKIEIKLSGNPDYHTRIQANPCISSNVLSLVQVEGCVTSVRYSFLVKGEASVRGNVISITWWWCCTSYHLKVLMIASNSRVYLKVIISPVILGQRTRDKELLNCVHPHNCSTGAFSNSLMVNHWIAYQEVINIETRLTYHISYSKWVFSAEF